MPTISTSFVSFNSPPYKFAKFLLSILKPLTINEFTIKDTFHFAEEIGDQQPDFFMGSWDVGSLFTNIPSEETLEHKSTFKESETIDSLSKSKFKERLSLATTDSHFVFDGTLYKNIDVVAMGSLLGPTLANAFLVYHKKIG